MRLEWMYISWGSIETCGYRKGFKPLCRLLNSSVFLLITNSPKQLGKFMTISHVKVAMYISRLFFLVLELFDWQIVILQEWKNFITILEWPRSTLRKKYLVFIIRYCSQTYFHWPVFGTNWMSKVMKKIQYQMILLCIQTIFFLSYQTCGLKGRNISILIIL